MFGKIVALVLSLGIIACALLAVRQARIQAFHELTQTRLRIKRQDEQILAIRTRIATLVTPEHIHEIAAAASDLKPLLEPTQSQNAEPQVFDDLGRVVPNSPGVPQRPQAPR
ncbi:MAG: hypothetical protein KF902_09580 [Phycisphaeraceae bacterium]|nr:hypothetical protein [Phycisphaeraceae bacterium]MCW5767749.1 hypothetical protein [Phycisphaeraceae bacterium]